MDIHTADTRAASAGTARRNDVERYNEYIDSLNKDRADRLLRLQEGAIEDENRVAEENEVSQIKGLVSATINVSTGKSDIKEALERNGIKLPSSGGEAMAKVGEAVKDTHAVQEATDIAGALDIAKASAGSQLGKIVDKTMLHAGGFMNIGMGIWDLGHDLKQGQVVLQGNELQQASQALQMGAGLADVVGFAVPPAKIAGAVLGVASAVAGELGDIEEEDIKIADVKKKARETKEKVKSEIIKPKLQTLEAEAPVRATTAKVYG